MKFRSVQQLEEVNRMLELAQQTAQTAIADANREAERIIAAARQEADEIRQRARAESGGASWSA